MKWAVSMSLAMQLSSHATTAVVFRQRGNAIQKTIAATVQTKEVRIPHTNSCLSWFIRSLMTKNIYF